MGAENTWPNYRTGLKRPLIRHKWIPIEGMFKSDICSKCGIVRRWEQSIGMYSYFKLLINNFPINHIGYRDPKCILPNTLIK
jgi:hypothetical protein